MRTRSQASAEKRVAVKRRQCDNSAAHDDGARSKRRGVQASGEEMACHSSAGAQREVGSCGDDEIPCEDHSTNTCEHGGKSSRHKSKPGFQRHILALPATVVKPSETLKRAPFRKQCKKDSLSTPEERGIVQIEGDVLRPRRKLRMRGSVNDNSCRNLLAQDNVVQPLQEDLHEQGVATPTQHHESCHQIEETAMPLLEHTGAQLQSEEGHRNEAAPTFGHEGAEKHLQPSHKKKGPLPSGDKPHKKKSCSESRRHLTKRKHEPLCPQSTEKKQRMRNSQKVNSAPMSIKLQKPSVKRMKAIKLRWKQLAQSILTAKFSSRESSSSDKIQVSASGAKYSQDTVYVKKHSLENCQSYERQLRPKKGKRLAGDDHSSRPGQRTVLLRQQQMIAKRKQRLLRWMTTWLTQAKFSQVTEDQSNNEMGKAFIMTEDERSAFIQTLLRCCEQNPNMRRLLLESVRILTLSGLMTAAASRLQQKEFCEHAQNVIDAWADFKEQDAATRKSPMNLLKAVNQLHEERGDLSTKLTISEGSYELKQVDEKTWKFKLPSLPIEDKSSSLPAVAEDLGQNKPVTIENLGQNETHFNDVAESSGCNDHPLHVITENAGQNNGNLSVFTEKLGQNGTPFPNVTESLGENGILLQK